LDWLVKNCRQTTSSHCRISIEYAVRHSSRVAERPLPVLGVVGGLPDEKGDLAGRPGLGNLVSERGRVTRPVTTPAT